MPHLYMCWENTSNQRYYQAEVKQDILGDIILMQSWGTTHTRLGGRKQRICTSYEEAIQGVLKLHQQRLKHGYQLIKSSGITLTNQGNHG